MVANLRGKSGFVTHVTFFGAFEVHRRDWTELLRNLTDAGVNDGNRAQLLRDSVDSNQLVFTMNSRPLKKLFRHEILFVSSATIAIQFRQFSVPSKASREV
jgi:hypothetical protein